MELNGDTTRVTHSCHFDVVAGDQIRFQKKIGDNPVENVIYEPIPEGEKWNVRIVINVDEV